MMSMFYAPQGCESLPYSLNHHIWISLDHSSAETLQDLVCALCIDLFAAMEVCFRSIISTTNKNTFVSKKYQAF